MQIRIYDDGAGRRSASGTDEVRDCLFVLGWGNRCRHENVQWLVDRLAERYRVHVAELPTHITDVEREWVTPLAEYAADLDRFHVLSHSAGGLAVAHLEADGLGNCVYLSPWWGSDYPLPAFVLGALTSLPISRPVVPFSELEADALGSLATDQQVADAPTAASPAFLGTIDRAQRRLPPARENAVAFCTLTDAIVDPRAVGHRLPADRIRLYDGGHELFSSTAREALTETVLEALERGPAGLRAADPREAQ
ncbi:alpha/beta fold hydrolase [Haloarcula salinisoli]|uniref:Alpha/beta hydrolase n=1 Tax=Haloarcula salinisoli TaxID=2487746 RepID=A0A8J7YAX4_9EURY|nr:alpha/beta hydrolase [Halomicroarcula salinisoli]MBX0286320.1 alpha/beta hydrolase [Halomicroarcula salinisoli]MBX0302192.1 alpha/beta hydrolase [Halomicroarcula salinisoli]